MKLKAFDPTGTYQMGTVYEPKNRKHAEQIMALHRNMGDGIEVIEEDDFDET